MKACPACARENVDDARFCSQCATPLAGETPAPREERKVVTVLFADLVGFTSRAERLDPEDVRALLGAYHARVRSELERFGGTVEKFVGDAVMALFGAPVAHEDDPQRAVRAALAIREWAAEEDDLQVRIGVTTGEALVALGARPAAGEGMASGDVVNTAARLQSAAPANGILVDESTYRATERVIEYRAAEDVLAKGKTEPVAVWEALRAGARVRVEHLGGAPLVGREQELTLLRQTLARVKEEREPQLVTLVGVPGIGKSRLVYELFQIVEADRELILWRQGRSLSYGEGVSFWALSEIVKAQAGVLDTDGAEQTEEKLRAAVATLVSDAAEVQWLERHLRPLVGLEAGDGFRSDRRAEAFAAWRRFLEALADQRPLVLVFEDLHFADDGLLDFVDHLVEWAGGVPLLVVGTARPELLSRRAGWGGGKANALTLSLSPLSDDETARLVHSLLDRPVLAAELQQAVLERAGGNPLYAEEFVRMADERGDRELPLPETVQGLIAARIDALPVEEKTLLQNAAVLGKVFWLGAAAALARVERWALEEGLHALERKEFLRRERRSSVAGEPEYTFRHLLVRDVAYGQIPRALRAEKHRLAARWLESLARPEDHAEMLAHHYLAALELARAVGQPAAETAAGARVALREAGDRAYALNAFAVAGRFYEQALELWPAGDHDCSELQFRFARALFMANDTRRQQALDEAREVLLADGRSERAAEADTLLADFWWHRGSSDRLLEHLERARRLVAELPPSPAKAHVLAQVSRFRALAEETEEAIRVGEEALAMADALGLDELRGHALNNIGVAKVSMGDVDGMADVERSLEIALAAKSPEAARAYNNLAAMAWMQGDARRARRLYEERRRVGEELGSPAHGAFARGMQIQLLFPEGKWHEALPQADDFVAACEAGEPHLVEADIRRERAKARLARADGNGALEDVRQAVALARQTKDPQTVLPALAAAVRVYAELGQTEEARQLAQEVLAAARGSRHEWALIDLAWVAHALGVAGALRQWIEHVRAPTRWGAAMRALLDGDFAAAADLFYEIGYLDEEAHARLRAAEQLFHAGRRSEADAHLEKALAFYRSVGATRCLREAEALLAATA